MSPKGVSNQTLELKIQKGHTLLDIEQMIHRVAISNLKSVDIWLARDLGIQLFKDTRITALLAAVSNRGLKMRVIDWITDPDENHLSERFGATVEGLSSLHYANEIVDAKKTHLENRIRHFRFDVVEKNGIKTPEQTYGKSLTFCAFDPELPTPIGFAGLSGKIDFTRRFSLYRRQCFEIGIGEGFSDYISESVDRAISNFVYELWQNTAQHGRFNAQNDEIRGMRYLRVQKHIGYDRKLFIQRAAGFSELRDYLEKALPKSGTFKLYEITIADNGLGIVERFLATRPEFGSNAQDIDISLLINKIIDQSLSSKRSRSGAGHGLEHAISAVRNLKGFVSIRSGGLWLYHSATEHQVKKTTKLLSVDYESKLVPVGTIFNLVFPLISPHSF